MFTFKQRGVCLLCDLFHIITLSQNNVNRNLSAAISQIRQIESVCKLLLYQHSQSKNPYNFHKFVKSQSIILI